MSLVSPFDSRSNPTTESSSRLTPQSNDILRRPGGRGQGPRDAVAGFREVLFDIQIFSVHCQEDSRA